MNRATPMLAALAMLLFGGAGQATAGTISVFATGVDNSNNPLPGGAQDPHYTITSGGTGPAIVLSPGNYWPQWPIPSTGKWIFVADTTAAAPGGSFSIATTFNLTGYDPSSARLTMTYTTDNQSGLYLNGVYTGISRGINDYSQLWNVSISSGFTSGVNTLAFNNIFSDTYDGMIVSAISVDATPLTPAAPEPASLTLMGFGIAGMAGYGWRRRRLAAA
jgi:PEP-CTERM motif